MTARKRLIVCFDGTWNAADSKRAETNVLKLARAIPIRDPAGALQLVLYLCGVGTGNFTDKVFGGATGERFENNLRSDQVQVPGRCAPIPARSRCALAQCFATKLSIIAAEPAGSRAGPSCLAPVSATASPRGRHASMTSAMCRQYALLSPP